MSVSDFGHGLMGRKLEGPLNAVLFSLLLRIFFGLIGVWGLSQPQIADSARIGKVQLKLAEQPQNNLSSHAIRPWGEE